LLSSIGPIDSTCRRQNYEGHYYHENRFIHCYLSIQTSEKPLFISSNPMQALSTLHTNRLVRKHE
jgi:hypothetical protein